MPGEGVFIPIHSHQLESLFLADAANVALGTHTRIHGALMPNDICAGADGVAGKVGGGGFKGEAQAGVGQAQIGGETEFKLTVFIGHGLPGGDFFVVDETLFVGKIIIVVYIGEAVTAQIAAGREGVGAGEETPFYLGIANPAAGEEFRIEGQGELFIAKYIFGCSRHPHLKFRFAVFGHREIPRANIVPGHGV